MTLTITLVLLIVALVCFILGAIDVPSRIGWTDAGLAFWVTAVILGGAI